MAYELHDRSVRRRGRECSPRQTGDDRRKPSPRRADWDTFRRYSVGKLPANSSRYKDRIAYPGSPKVAAELGLDDNKSAMLMAALRALAPLSLSALLQ